MSLSAITPDMADGDEDCAFWLERGRYDLAAQCLDEGSVLPATAMTDRMLLAGELIRRGLDLACDDGKWVVVSHGTVASW